MSAPSIEALSNARVAAKYTSEHLLYAMCAHNEGAQTQTHVERAWTHYHALGEALRATGVEPPQPPEGVGHEAR